MRTNIEQTTTASLLRRVEITLSELFPSGTKARPMFVTAGVILIYCLLGFLLIAQKPGLQYDEAMLVAGGVHMDHSRAVFELDNTPNAWVCPFHHCVPLMAFLYVGALKEYANFPFFATVGPHTWLIRLVALMFGAFCIWGIRRLIEPWFGLKAAVLCALVLAINPAFLNMVTFDNGATGALMGGLGVTCVCVALYATRKSTLAAFGLGAAIGFGVWSRANFVWFVLAGAASAVVVFRRRILIPISHVLAIAIGGILGGLPFLVYQIVSDGATWKAQDQFTLHEPLGLLFRQRIFLLADTLLSDGEHRRMWDGPPLPAWQLWFFPIVLLLAVLVCLFGSGREPSDRRSFARFLTLTLLFTAGFLFFSRLPVAEHHLFALIPFAAATVVLACFILQARFRSARVLSVALLTLYVSSCLYWEVRSVYGLRQTGGIGVWSNAGLELARYIDRDFANREIKMLDWGFQYNLYVLTNGRIRAREIYSTSSNLTESGRSWSDEVSDGGVFLLHGPQNREFPQASKGFLRAVAGARPVIVQKHSVMQQNGLTYAQLIEIAPGSAPAPVPGQRTEAAELTISMRASRMDTRLTGFYPPEPQGFRWSQRLFSARLDLSNLSPSTTGNLELSLRFYVPENTIRTLGTMTLKTRVGDQQLAPESISSAGQHVLRREFAQTSITGDSTEVHFQLDKAVPASSSDARELGLAVSEMAVETE